MKISTKGRYALRMLLDLAEHPGVYVSLGDVAARQGISKKYLEQIIPILTRGGLLRTVRGYQGGYMLAKTPDKYTVGEILRLTEGDLMPVACLLEDPAACPRSADCLTRPLWEGLAKVINDYLGGITLQDLLDRKREPGAWDFVI